jgi:hypothetical protein
LTRPALCLAAILVGACASQDLRPVRPEDGALTCSQLADERANAQRMREEALSERSRSAIDPARSRLLWPSILGVDKRSAAETEHAVAVAEARSAHLAKLMREKRCPLPSGVVAIRT